MRNVPKPCTISKWAIVILTLILIPTAWKQESGYEMQISIKMANRENEKWNVGYIDLFLIHFPFA